MRNLRKVFAVLICIFLAQSLVSCFNQCEDSQTFSVSYESVNIETFDTSGFGLKDSDSALFKNAFAIRINIQTTEEEIADYRIAFSAGFNTAKAEDCGGLFFEYEDKISDAEIIRIDENGIETNMTTAFSWNNNNGDFISIAEIMEEAYEYPDYINNSFSLELLDYNDLPQSFKLRVDVILESGTILTQETGTLYFVD